MDPADLSNLIAGGALVVSVFAIARGEITRRGSKQQAAKADAAAEKSAEAAERSAAALEKMADQWADSMSRAEKRDQRQWSRPLSGRPDGYETRGSGPWAGLPPTGGRPEPVVHWTVDRTKGRQHMLKNLGRATAYDVELSSENSARFDAPAAPRNLQMGEALEFLAIGSMQTGTPELVVSWRDSPDGDLQEWRRPLP